MKVKQSGREADDSFSSNAKFKNAWVCVCVCIYIYTYTRFLYIYIYRGADKSLARPGRKKAIATEYFSFHISYL